MGDRATLQLTFGDQGGIYLYTHWNGHDMPLRLQSALALAQSRWDDQPYLARFIVSHIIGDGHTSLTGHGLSPFPVDTEYSDLVADLNANTVHINGHTYTFPQYIEADVRDIRTHWDDYGEWND